MRSTIVNTYFFMKLSWFFISILCSSLSKICHGQSNTKVFKQETIAGKPFIDSSTVNTWPFLGDFPRISNDGRYFKYNYNKGEENQNILVVASIDTLWKIEIPGADYITGYFSSDCKSFVFKNDDTLFFLQLKSKAIRKVEKVSSLKLPDKNTGEWLAYQLKGESKIVILYNLISKQHAQFEGVENFSFNKNGSALVLKMTTIQADIATTSLKWISLPSCKILNIYECSYPANKPTRSIGGVTFSPNGYQIAFIVQNKDSTRLPEYINRTTIDPSPTNNELWYYASDMNEAVLKANNLSECIPKGLSIYTSNPMFSGDGKFIYFQLYQPFVQTEKPTGVQVDVWGYRDTLLQSAQLVQPFFSRFSAVVSTTGSKIIQLTGPYESIRAYAEKAPFVVINYNTMDDRFWLNTPDTNWLVSLVDGSRTKLPSGYKHYFFSPNGFYLIFFDLSDYNYYSYNLATKEISNISSTVQPGLLAFKLKFYYNYPAGFQYPPVGVGAWEANDRSLLVYDQYDIWWLDPSGKLPASNLTKGVGRTSKTMFRLTYGMASSNNPIIISENEPILLTALNSENKNNGFFTTTLNPKKPPHPLIYGPKVYDLSSHNLLPYNAQNFNTGYGMAPVKAKNAQVWIIRQQSIAEAPNYFFTKDLKTFRQLTNFRPHEGYNWLSAELIKWEQPDGIIAQGILYKPENFDATKKYPVIFNYYQQRTHRFNQFPSPGYTIANIDVAWFVSRGYLVFTPDIYFKFGETGWSAYNTMVSAAHILAKLPYVDSLKMAINGHSVAGGLTNFLISKTNIFAAAIECAGTSNTISSALQLSGTANEESRLGGAEFSLGNVSIWQNPKKYVDVSPIMNADKIETPLLIMHNKKDGGVPWAQALELYLSLRRLEKPVWLLQYDKGDHSLWGTKEEAKDFTIRTTQFLDHFLKGVPPPKWMAKGIPAKLKGIDPGYELLEDRSK